MKPFDDLPDGFKQYLIESNSVFIGSIRYYNRLNKLYYMKGVYVEIQIDEDQDAVEKICLLKDNGVDKYINQVQLPDLFDPL